MDPKVTFIIPCYKLAHLLPECIDSILKQTFRDFEILIMDDCSPDNTPEVARSFADPRVKHIRNEPNLGHLRNYNKGIGLAKGKYIWLISADDRVRGDRALEQYVQLMEAHPNVGYVFSPAVSLVDGRETEVAGWTSHGDKDFILSGRRFLSRLANCNAVAAAAGMVRRECYEKVSVFPLDLPDMGDWFLWCVFALHYDVAYLAQPMVSYRLHEMSMTNQMTSLEHFSDDLGVRWRMKRLAEEARSKPLSRLWLKSVASRYARCLVSARFHTEEFPMSFDDFEESLKQRAKDAGEARIVRARVYASVGDLCYVYGKFADALCYYDMALHIDPWTPVVLAKIILLRMGKAGMFVRNNTPGFRSTTLIGKSGLNAE